MDRPQLAEFLRSRRARVTPADVGLSAGTRRRTPGLRREEVAQLAGISVDYYIRLEQARGPHPSAQVLGSLARALRLDDDERGHLHHLAGQAPAPLSGPSPDVTPGVLGLLDRLHDTPAFVLDAKYDVLAWNALTAALLGDFGSLPPAERNLAWRLFGSCAPSRFARDDRDAFADQCVADLRAAAARYPADPAIRALLARLHAVSPEFTRRWDDHRVATPRTAVKHLHHPVVGELELVCDVLDIPERGQRLVLYTAVPGSRSAEALRLLAVVGPQWDTAADDAGPRTSRSRRGPITSG